MICTLSRDDVKRLILQYPSFALRLIEAIGGRMVEAERQLEALAFKTVVTRLAESVGREARGGRIDGFGPGTSAIGWASTARRQPRPSTR